MIAWQHDPPTAVRPRLAILLSIFAVPAACDGTDRVTTATVSPGVPITVDNGLAVAGAAWRAAVEPLRVARIGASFLTTPPPSPLPPAAVVTWTQTGPEGGEALLTWDDRDGDRRYSDGDTFAVALSDYGDGGFVLTGAITFDQYAVDGDVLDGLAWVLDCRARLVSLRVVTASSSATVNGVLRIGRERRATVGLLAVELEQAFTYGARTLAPGTVLARNDYVLDFAMALFAAGTVEDAVLGGTLQFRDTAPLTGFQFLPDPFAGAFEVTGGSGLVEIAPIDFFHCEVRIDADEDGVFDAVLPVAWADL